MYTITKHNLFPFVLKLVKLIIFVDMRTLTLDIPEELNLNDKYLLMILAGKLYEDGKLTSGQAAKLAGLTKKTFLELLGNFGYSVFNYPVTDLEKDLLNA